MELLRQIAAVEPEVIWFCPHGLESVWVMQIVGILLSDTSPDFIAIIIVIIISIISVIISNITNTIIIIIVLTRSCITTIAVAFIINSNTIIVAIVIMWPIIS